MEKITVLVVDDSVFMRNVITDILNSDPEIEVVGQASDGIHALKKIQEFNPQVITLDLEMPHMNGLETIQKLMQLAPHPTVIMVSAFTSEGAGVTLQCLEAGAVDFVLKPSGPRSLDMDKVKEKLIATVKSAALVNMQTFKKKSVHIEASTIPKNAHQQPGIIVIGSSTGGPVALERLLPLFPPEFSYPILVAQHMPLEFIVSFVKRLEHLCHVPVRLAKDGEKIENGIIYIVPGNVNTQVRQDADDLAVFSTTETDVILTPSIDLLMKSVVAIYKEATVGIILTGMGDDGAVGMQAIKEAGGRTLVQDEKSSTVFGMGRAVVERGFADLVVPLDEIVEHII